MAAVARVVIDDRLLVEELLVGLRRRRRSIELHTTTYWYFRACRAAAAAAGGHLSGPFERLADDHQQRAIRSLLHLRHDIGLPDPRLAVPAMAELAQRHPRLNLLNLEATAAAQLLGATVWLSEQGARGVLPAILDAEAIPWREVAVGG